MALRRSGVRIPLGPFLFLKHIEKVDPYQGAAHGFESLWVHKKRPFGCFFIILD